MKPPPRAPRATIHRRGHARQSNHPDQLLHLVRWFGLTATRYEIRFTASAETRDYLRRAQDLLGHAIPDGDLDRVFNRSLRLLVRELERKKFAATERPRRSRGKR